MHNTDTVYLNSYRGGVMEDVRAPLPAKPVRFMDQFRAFIRLRQLAYATEKTYCVWVKDFIRFHQKRHPKNMGKA